MPSLLFALLVLILLAGFAYTQIVSSALSRRFPPSGDFYDIGGYRMHAVHIPAGPDADLPPLVFIHGASGNLRDQMTAFRDKLDGRAEMLFIDRPGHGWSERGGPQNDTPDGQAEAIASLMSQVGMEKAIIIGHSYGGAVTASFALLHPEMTDGLVFLSPATHPWPGGIAWYNHVTATPIIGALFANIFALPAGQLLIKAGVESVFAPNPVPDNYVEDTGAAMVLRPSEFIANARDLVALNDYLARTAPHYGEIKAPTVIITGDSDDVVSPTIHSLALSRAISGSKLLEIAGLGHKPDYVVGDLVIASIEKLAGREIDLENIASAIHLNSTPDDVAPEHSSVTKPAQTALQ